MVNKYGNDFKNNIMWNKEYPFIPEVTNDAGFTIHEGDIVDYWDSYHKRYEAARVYKIYNKDIIWTRIIDAEKRLSHFERKANDLFPYRSNTKIPKLEDFDNQGISNELERFLGSVYAQLYYEELKLSDDWHCDEEKFEKKRLEEVARLKNKY